MNTNNVTDPARLSLLLNELRLPAIKLLWSKFAEQADKEGWPAARFLAAIAEHELPGHASDLRANAAAEQSARDICREQRGAQSRRKFHLLAIEIFAEMPRGRRMA